MDRDGGLLEPEESGQFASPSSEDWDRLVWIALDGYHRGRWWLRTARTAIEMVPVVPAMGDTEWEAVVDALQVWIGDEEERLGGRVHRVGSQAG